MPPSKPELNKRLNQFRDLLILGASESTALVENVISCFSMEKTRILRALHGCYPIS